MLFVDARILKIGKDFTRVIATDVVLPFLRHSVVWTVALYSSESWTLKANNIDKLKAFEMTCYRRMLQISWNYHRTNKSVISEIGADRQLVAPVRKRKLQYFGHIITA